MATRRSPDTGDRQRDAERSRRLLMDAAVVEFAAHGVGGARVASIADRAGVNKQLISYYFGGKEGLYAAIGDRWREEERDLAGPDATIPEVAAGYARLSVDRSDLARLVVREGLDGMSGGPESDAAQRQRFEHVLADLRRRQETGEIDPGVDAGAVGLAVFAVAIGPVSFPHIARAMGLDPDADGFADRWADEVSRIVTRLCGDPGPTIERTPDPRGRASRSGGSGAPS